MLLKGRSHWRGITQTQNNVHMFVGFVCHTMQLSVEATGICKSKSRHRHRHHFAVRSRKSMSDLHVKSSAILQMRRAITQINELHVKGSAIMQMCCLSKMCCPSKSRFEVKRSLKKYVQVANEPTCTSSCFKCLGHRLPPPGEHAKYKYAGSTFRGFHPKRRSGTARN